MKIKYLKEPGRIIVKKITILTNVQKLLRN